MIVKNYYLGWIADHICPLCENENESYCNECTSLDSLEEYLSKKSEENDTGE